MKIQIDKTQTVFITVMAVALILAGSLFYSNRSLKDQLQKEKIRSEALVSETLNMDKAIEKFKKDLNSLKGKNTELDKVVKQTSDQLAKKEAAIKKLMAENASLADLKIKNEELETLRKKLEDKIAKMNLDMDQLIAENKEFNEKLSSVKTENESLAVHNALLEAMLADNYRVEALKGKHDKLTVVARRTDKLMVSFDIPSEIGQEMFFKIKTPKGDELSSKDDKSASIKFINQNTNLMASLTGSSSGSTMTKRAELVYKPDQKLTKGIYGINVYNGNDYVGSIQVRLK